MAGSSKKALLDYDYRYYPDNYESGILRNYPLSRVSACSTCHDVDYADGLSVSEISSCSGPYLFVGAKVSGYIFLGAWGPVAEVQTTTAVNSPHIYNGVYWYFNSQSFGFSLNPSISQSSGDTASTDPDYRLSWHIGSGGYRAGSETGLNSDTTYSKVIYNCPSGSTYSNGDTSSSSYTRGVATGTPTSPPTPTPTPQPTTPTSQPSTQVRARVRERDSRAAVLCARPRVRVRVRLREGLAC
jgi:hypothetical protein